MSIRLGAAALAAVLVASAAHAQPSGKTYTLEATPTTVAWGNYDATTKPVLTIKSGDTVVFHTGDLAITEIVDRNKAVHMTMPKAIFTK